MLCEQAIIVDGTPGRAGRLFHAPVVVQSSRLKRVSMNLTGSKVGLWAVVMAAGETHWRLYEQLLVVKASMSGTSKRNGFRRSADELKIS